MITFGTIQKINPTENGCYVLISTASNGTLICSAKNTNGLAEGAYVAIGGDKNKQLITHAMLKEYDPTINYLTQPEYKSLWQAGDNKRKEIK